MKKLIGYAFFAYFWSVAKAFEFVCLVEGVTRKLLCGAPALSTQDHKNFSLQNGEKIREKTLRPTV